MIMKNLLIKISSAIIIFLSIVDIAYANEEVNVYSYRQPILIEPFFDEFTKKTVIKVNVLHEKKCLL